MLTNLSHSIPGGITPHEAGVNVISISIFTNDSCLHSGVSGVRGGKQDTHPLSEAHDVRIMISHKSVAVLIRLESLNLVLLFFSTICYPSIFIPTDNKYKTVKTR